MCADRSERWVLTLDNDPVGFTEGTVEQVVEVAKRLVAKKLALVQDREGEGYGGDGVEGIRTSMHRPVVFAKVYVGFEDNGNGVVERYIVATAYAVCTLSEKSIEGWPAC